ncbi:acyltransferase [Cronobacter dublinensis]|nr:acyltransferase [Cronobacter dublinensis]
MNNKYLFAQYLRGVAALSVMFAHFGTSFFNANDTLSLLVNAKPVEDRSYPWIISLIPIDFPGFMAVFGVSVFFLISGFVIPMSIERYSVTDFLSKRFFRLVPTYIFVFTLNMLIALLGLMIYKSQGIEYVYTIRNIIGAYFIGFNTFISGAIWLDPVAWTLAVEITFYLISAIFFNASFMIRKVKEINLWDVVILSGILHLAAIKISKHYDALNAIAPWINIGNIIKAIYLIAFMLVGTTFYLHAKGRIGIQKLVFTVAIQYFAFLYTNLHIHSTAVYVGIVPTFSWFAISLLAFSLCYAVNDKIKEHRALGFLADISYPLYLCHSYIGYLLMSIIIEMNFLPRSLVVFLPFPVAIYVAYLIHKFVEMPTHRMSFSGRLRIKGKG